MARLALATLLMLLVAGCAGPEDGPDDGPGDGSGDEPGDEPGDAALGHHQWDITFRLRGAGGPAMSMHTDFWTG